MRSGKPPAAKCMHYARQACDIVSQLLPKGTLVDRCQRVHRDLSVLRERLRVVDSRHNDSTDERHSRLRCFMIRAWVILTHDSVGSIRIERTWRSQAHAIT
jgi:hypothetical protein